VKNFLRSNNFFTVTRARAACFAAVCVILFSGFLYGQTIYYSLFGEGNTFVYKSGNLAVHFLDVGHGDCAILQLPDGKTAVIDGGDELYYPRIKTYIRERIKPRDNKIDYLISTHPHSDHLGGLVQIAKNFKVGTVFRSYDTYPKDALSAFSRANEVKIIADADTVENLESAFGYRLRFQACAVRESEVDETSQIITLEYGDQVFVFTGDAGFETETKFIGDASAEDSVFGTGEKSAALCVYLKVGHHGSKNSTSMQFLDFIKPDYAVISCGTLSQKLYNQPNPETMLRIENSGARAILTRELGNIVIRCNGNSVKIFFAFDNPANLLWLYLVVFLGSAVLCFVNKKTFKNL
jgi:competence protein ComEC